MRSGQRGCRIGSFPVYAKREAMVPLQHDTYGDSDCLNAHLSLSNVERCTVMRATSKPLRPVRVCGPASRFVSVYICHTRGSHANGPWARKSVFGVFESCSV